MLTEIFAGTHALAPGHNQLIALIAPVDQLVNLVLTTLVFAIIGILLFALAFFIIVKVSPFSTRKEIEEDQNVALAILIGSVIIGIAIIVAAAVHG
jgi:putative membrane protein